MDATQAKFEGWAVVELFGHQREVGFVTTQYFGDKAMFQIDVPELPEREYTTERPEYLERKIAPAGAVVKREAVAARSRLISPGAVYAMNPCTEAAARRAIETLVSRPLILVSLPESAQLTAADPEDVEEMEYEDDEEN